MHFLYIIHSNSLNKYYIGETADLENRLAKHKAQHYKHAYTKAASDWKLVLEKECHSKEQALHLERFIKRMKSSKFTKKILDNPEILDEIWNQKR